MRIVITVEGDESGTDLGLHNWLSGEPELRGRIRRSAVDAPPAGAMGVVGDALIALLEPGGVAAVFAGAVVGWAQSRRGSQTITITRPDGVEITISATHVRNLDARQTAELAQQLAAAVQQPSAGDTAPPASADGDGEGGPREQPPTV
ncbi:effector-associated constant component EACC1 [Streptomyces sp. NRRL B-3648]|uniref:effector-associated constant component EACC1 n=1 Tax=Streptomyces sp. NRRL B-3648 TaxID=1519493 RepID=UPI0006B03427|nr:hypothetical protein [Streptomyces sp. NRRL B-3648]